MRSGGGVKQVFACAERAAGSRGACPPADLACALSFLPTNTGDGQAGLGEIVGMRWETLRERVNLGSHVAMSRPLDRRGLRASLHAERVSAGREAALEARLAEAERRLAAAEARNAELQALLAQQPAIRRSPQRAVCFAFSMPQHVWLAVACCLGPDSARQGSLAHLEHAGELRALCREGRELARALPVCGKAPALLARLAGQALETRCQAAWALGNLLGLGAGIRDGVLKLGLIPPLLALLDEFGDPAPQEEPMALMARKVTWSLREIFTGKPGPDLDQAKGAHGRAGE